MKPALCPQTSLFTFADHVADVFWKRAENRSGIAGERECKGRVAGIRMIARPDAPVAIAKFKIFKFKRTGLLLQMKYKRFLTFGIRGANTAIDCERKREQTPAHHPV